MRVVETVTARVPAGTDASLHALAQAEGKKVSAIIREAIAARIAEASDSNQRAA